jgi:hypothetical protein
MIATYNQGVTRAPSTLIENNQFRVKIVSERNREKQQNQSAGECRPFPKRVAAVFGTLAQPSRPPEAQGYGGNRHPQKVEK